MFAYCVLFAETLNRTNACIRALKECLFRQPNLEVPNTQF